jgi:hypothetical protein
MSIFLTDEEHTYVVERLDHDHIRELAEQARVKLDRGQTVECCYQPGDATWYSLILARVDNVLGAEGGGTGGLNPHSFIGGEGTYVLVYAQREQATYFSAEENWEWVASKVTDNRASIVAIGQFLEAVFS